MAEALYLVTKVNTSGLNVINGLQAVIINADDAATGAVVRAAAVTAANAAHPSGTGEPVYPAGYFDTSVIISDLVAGPLKDAGDAYIFIADSVPLKREGG